MYISNVESHSHSITVCPYIREKIVIYLQKEKRFILVFKYLKRIGVKKFSYQNQLEGLWRFEYLQTFREIAFQFLYALHITNALFGHRPTLPSSTRLSWNPPSDMILSVLVNIKLHGLKTHHIRGREYHLFYIDPWLPL